MRGREIRGSKRSLEARREYLEAGRRGLRHRGRFGRPGGKSGRQGVRIGRQGMKVGKQEGRLEGRVEGTGGREGELGETQQLIPRLESISCHLPQFRAQPLDMVQQARSVCSSQQTC